LQKLKIKNTGSKNEYIRTTSTLHSRLQLSDLFHSIIHSLSAAEAASSTKMGRSNKNSMTEDHTISSMLFITMSIIGLPVDVHVKDGSVYSGIFHTASFDAGFGTLFSLIHFICQNNFLLH
jgi:hypothetical protein